MKYLVSSIKTNEAPVRADRNRACMSRVPDSGESYEPNSQISSFLLSHHLHCIRLFKFPLKFCNGERIPVPANHETGDARADEEADNLPNHLCRLRAFSDVKGAYPLCRGVAN